MARGGAREGAGRKRIYDTPLININIRTTEEIKSWMAERAKSKGQPVGAVLEELVTYFRATHEE